MALSASIKTRVQGSLTGSPDIGATVHTFNELISLTLANGTGAGQCNQYWSDTRTITASGNEDIDLAGGVTNALGTTLTFTAVKCIIISAAAGNTNNVNVTRPASNGFIGPFLASSDGLAIKPGGFVVLSEGGSAAGWAVTASTGDLINVANSAGTTSVTYTIHVFGEA